MRALILGMVLILFPVGAFGAWVNACEDPQWQSTASQYCKCVGRQVWHDSEGIRRLMQAGRSIPPVGSVIGVAWRPKGSLISKDGRTTPRNAFYYIVDDGRPDPFLKNPRESVFEGGARLWCR